MAHIDRRNGSQRSAQSGLDSAKLPSAARDQIHLDLGGAFPTDKAELDPAARGKLERATDKFIANYNTPEKFGNLLLSTWTLQVSCDPRPTPNWPEGNLGLAKARAETLQQLFRERLESFSFDPKIPASQVDRLKKKLIRASYPEDGVKEIPHLNTSGASRERQLAGARRASIDLRPRGGTIEEQNLALLAEGTSQDTGKTTLLVDISPSMNDDRERLVRSFASLAEPNMPEVTVIPFAKYGHFLKTKTLSPDPAERAAKKEEFADFFRNYGRGSSDERPLSVLDEFFAKHDETQASGHRSVILATDEGLHYFSLDRLKALQDQAKTHNSDLTFVLFPMRSTTQMSTVIDLPRIVTETEGLITKLTTDPRAYNNGVSWLLPPDNSVEENKKYIGENMFFTVLANNNDSNGGGLTFVLSENVLENHIQSNFELQENAAREEAQQKWEADNNYPFEQKLDARHAELVRARENAQSFLEELYKNGTIEKISYGWE